MPLNSIRNDFCQRNSKKCIRIRFWHSAEVQEIVCRQLTNELCCNFDLKHSIVGIGIKYAWVVAKILLVHLLRNYKFKTHLKSLKDIRTKVSIILKIANKNPIQVEKRVW